MNMSPGLTPILQGLRVVEASAFVAVPLGGMTLAQMGADVIRIDPLGGGVDRHRWPVTAGGASLFWNGLNKLKRSVALDLGSAEGRELAAAIATAPGEDAGLLLTNLPPRGWLQFEALRARRPDLIQLTLQGDRHGGTAVDYTVNTRVGLPFITGPVDGAEVVNHVLPAWDLVSGQMAALGLLAAERHRRKTGEGQQVSLALEDVALAVMGHLGFIAEAQLGAERPRMGNELFGAFGRDFTTADGQRVMVVGLTARQWRTLVQATGLASGIQALAARLRLDLDQEGARHQARAEIAALVGPWIAARPLADVAAAFDAHGVCWSRYRTLQQLVHEDLAGAGANPLFAPVQQPGVGTLLTPAVPLAFSAAARVPPGPAPRLGQHTGEVLSDLLGLNDAQVGELQRRGVVGLA